MAPGKRKKKPATNPSRGFATVSVPSRPKTEEIDQAVSGAPTSNGPASEQASKAASAAGESFVARKEPLEDTTSTSAISDMTPAQLEAHLEDSHLQSLVETHGSKCKSNSKRQASRLQDERRLLRSHTTGMNSNLWTDGTVVRILERWPKLRSSYKSADSDSEYGEISDDTSLVLNLWTLQSTLQNLGLPTPNDAVAHVVQLNFRKEVSKVSDMAWGLEEALDWYALRHEDMPGYDELPTNVHEKQDSVPRMANHPALRNSDSDNDSLLQSGLEVNAGQNKPKNDGGQTALKPSIQQRGGDDHLSLSGSEASSEDEDNDPTLLVRRYVRLQEKLWRATQALPAGNGQPEGTDNKRLASVRSKIANMERDVLFDKGTADVEWARKRIQLQAEGSLNRREAKAKINEHAKHENATVTGDHNQLEEQTPDSQESFNIDQGESDVFGGMFDTNRDAVESDPDARPHIRIIDFGHWTGLAPRQLLTQVCRTIDALATFHTAAIQATSYSARHKIELNWNVPCLPDNSAAHALPDEVQLVTSAQSWTVAMVSIAASTAAQSIEYVSVMALFLLLSMEGQDRKAGMRLTGIWRNLLNNLFDSYQHMVDNADKAALESLHKDVENARNLIGETDKSTGRQWSFPRQPEDFHGHENGNNSDSHSSNVLELWKTNQGSPAFQKMLDARRRLPIYAHRDEILDTISKNAVSIVSAETGSGKSTQVGSFLLEHELSSGRDCRILVTEPRRIAAISLARRVSQELGEASNDLGTNRSLVGYAIRLENRTSSSTRLTFATTGVLLRMLESTPTLRQLDYIILDEVHERTMEMDLLFIAIRELLQKRPTLKVVLMSATANAKLFSAYFDNAPILHIPGRTFPVEQLFLEDAIEATKDIETSTEQAGCQSDDLEVDFEEDHRQEVDHLKLSGYSASTQQRVANTVEHRIDYDLIVKLAVTIATQTRYAKYSKAMLIFMPGIAEIRRLYQAILSTDTFCEGWDLHMLHSSFSTEELERAFAIPRGTRRKIVIATNIAETGITIPDVTAVIDTAKEKILRFNERRQLSKLTEGFISRASAKQRRGRAARLQDGICFHLITKHRHDNLLLEQQVPEMLRLSLQDAIMRIKLWRLGSITDTFAQAIEPPSQKTIVRAIEKLKDAGALNSAEDLTPLGKQVARLPLDVRLAKLAVLGSVLRCLDSVLMIISLMTSKSPFLQNDAGLQSRLAFKRADSDLLTLYNAYCGWKKAKLAGKGVEFCRKHHLLEQVLLQAEDQKVQLLVYLVDGGQVVLESHERQMLNQARAGKTGRGQFYEIPERYNLQAGDELILSLIAMAFYPRVLVREGKGWRNVYNNQQVSLAKGSVNHDDKTPPKWLSFTETMQTKAGKLNVFETSRIPDLALALLLGEATVNVFAGIVSVDNGKIRLSVKHWRQALALKAMRLGLKETFDYFYRHRGAPASDSEIFWTGMLLAMTVA